MARQAHANRSREPIDDGFVLFDTLICIGDEPFEESARLGALLKHLCPSLAHLSLGGGVGQSFKADKKAERMVQETLLRKDTLIVTLGTGIIKAFEIGPASKTPILCINPNLGKSMGMGLHGPAASTPPFPLGGWPLLALFTTDAPEKQAFLRFDEWKCRSESLPIEFSALLREPDRGILLKKLHKLEASCLGHGLVND